MSKKKISGSEIVDKTSIIKIHCPICGWEQEVERDMWNFQSSLVGHGYTCGSGKCPSHTYMVMCVA